MPFILHEKTPTYYTCNMYSVIQSDGNSHFGDVVFTVLMWHTGMKIAFETKNMKSKYFGIFIIKILKYTSDVENAHLKKYST